MKTIKLQDGRGTYYFNENGVYHNDQGPADIRNDGQVRYFYDGVQMSKEEWERYLELLAFV